MLPAEPFNAEASARERILHRAHQLFYQHGIRATGVDKIIAAAGVTKVTFYRHFPAKNELVLAFLERRHQRWIHAFQQTLARESQRQAEIPALLAALESWFTQPDFRGCAFINAASELADTLPEAMTLVQQHKRAMCEVIKTYLPAGQKSKAEVVAMLVDGAIVQVQMGKEVAQTMDLFRVASEGVLK